VAAFGRCFVLFVCPSRYRARCSALARGRCKNKYKSDTHYVVPNITTYRMRQFVTTRWAIDSTHSINQSKSILARVMALSQEQEVSVLFADKDFFCSASSE
jgi:hypothetical protein